MVKSESLGSCGSTSDSHYPRPWVETLWTLWAWLAGCFTCKKMTVDGQRLQHSANQKPSPSRAVVHGQPRVPNPGGVNANPVGTAMKHLHVVLATRHHQAVLVN